MRLFKRIFKGEPQRPAEEAIEGVPILEFEEEARAREVSEVEPIYVKSVDLRSLADVQTVADELRAGNIVILDIAQFMDQNPEELKRAVDQLKGIAQGIGGDVGRLTEAKIIATPRFVRIQFKRPEA